MAREEQLDILSRGVPVWNEWRATSGARFIDLTQAMLKGRDLQGANFDSAHLRGADLAAANLRGASLRDASLAEAILDGANLSNADLTKASLFDSMLREADLTNAKLGDVLFGQAQLGCAILRSADLSDARLSYANLHDANLSSAKLHNAKLRDVNLWSADLTNADLQGADLENAGLKGALLVGASLSSARCANTDFRFANLNNTSLYDTDFTSADLSGGSLRGAMLWHTRFTLASLRHADFADAILEKVIFGDTDLAHVQNLMTCTHKGPSVIDFMTIARSYPISELFLRGCGLHPTVVDNLAALIHGAAEFHSCFISYSHVDQRFARILYKHLRRHGVVCWLDEHDLVAGSDLHDSIKHGIQDRDRVVLCCSEASLTSWWVDNELETALARERKLMSGGKPKQSTIIPITLDDFLFSGNWKSGKAEQVLSRAVVDLRRWKSGGKYLDAAIERVVTALKVRRP